MGLMKHDFGGKRVKDGERSEGVKQVFLEENYRSTGHILQAAKGIIEAGEWGQDAGAWQGLIDAVRRQTRTGSTVTSSQASQSAQRWY